MTDVTILIPTFRHAAVLPYAIDSALDQEGASIELFVVGDGVEDATREVMARYEGDGRVRFFDLPKGPRLGEAHRHPLMPQASGRIVTYLSDDDILLRDHAATMLELLENADFAHPPSARFRADGSLLFFPWDYSRPEFRDVARGRRRVDRADRRRAHDGGLPQAPARVADDAGRDADGPLDVAPVH